MPRLSAEEWSIIRQERELKGITLTTLADRYGISHVAIVKKAKAEGWDDGQDANAKANRLAFEKASKIISNEKGIKAREESIEKAADVKAEVIKKQQKDYINYRECFKREDINYQDMEIIKKAEIVARTIAIQHEGERKAYNITVGEVESEKSNRPITINDLYSRF